MIYIPSFIKTGPAIQKLTGEGGDKQTAGRCVRLLKTSGLIKVVNM
jgi:hypothetical protein